MIDNLLLLTNWVDRFNVLFALGIMFLFAFSVLIGCLLGFVFLWAEKYGGDLHV